MVFWTLFAATINCLFLNIGLPNITDVSDNQTTLVGNNVSLSCTATGSPLPRIQWRKDDGLKDQSIVTSRLSSSSVTSTLSLFAVTSQDSGLYFCDALIGLDNPPFERLLLTVQGKEMGFSGISNIQ